MNIPRNVKKVFITQSGFIYGLTDDNKNIVLGSQARGTILLEIERCVICENKSIQDGISPHVCQSCEQD